MAGFMRAILKAVRFMRKDREAAINSVAKFIGIEKAMAGRMYDDLISTFTANGSVDEETQRNDLAIDGNKDVTFITAPTVAQIVGVRETIPPARAYDFSFALEADQQLNKAGWKP